ncbi:unnamed protein product, partial [Meganyctiphanes norvegica]
ETMSDVVSQDLGYNLYLQRLPTLKYNHAVAFTGQKILHFILRTLICGDINNISGCVRGTLTSNTQYKNSFTKYELQLLEKGEHTKWYFSLLFKVIQKVCGLAPAGTNCWTRHTGDDDEPLEYLLIRLKKINNKIVGKFDIVLTEDEMDKGLTELLDLSTKMAASLRLIANKKGKQFSEDEAIKTIDHVFRIVADVREKIYEGAPTTKSPKETMSDEESHDFWYIPFLQRLPTLRYTDAVALTGQKLLHFILRTLICGDINISDCVREAFTSNTQCKISFTKYEQQLLEKGEHTKWEITLLFK